MGVSMGAEVVNRGGARAQAPKTETAPAAAIEVKPVPPEVKPPAPPAAAPTTEVVENPYGLEALWRQGDFVARGTLIILMIMSIGSWYIGIIKVIEQARMLKDGKEADEKRSEEHTSELQSLTNLVCRLLLEKKTTYRRQLRRRLSPR